MMNKCKCVRHLDMTHHRGLQIHQPERRSRPSPKPPSNFPTCRYELCVQNLGLLVKTSTARKNIDHQQIGFT